MSWFDSASLSPMPITARARDLPYGLEWRDLESVLPAACVARAVTESHEKRGLDGGESSRILTLSGVCAGTSFERVVFVKRIDDPRAFEAQRYQHLGAHGIRTPDLLATVTRAGGEILVLEFLPRLGIDFGSTSEVHSLLELTARLNAVPAGRDVPTSRLMQSDDFDAGVLSALHQLEVHPALELSVSRIFDAYLHAQARALIAHPAVTHGQLYFQHVGWRGEDALCVFDLATLAMRPRFWDVGSILPRLAEASGSPEIELFEVYLDALRGSGGALRMPECVAEMRAVRAVKACWSLQWLLSATRESDELGLHDELALTLRWLCRDVGSLSSSL